MTQHSCHASGIFPSPYSQCGAEFRYKRCDHQKSVLVQSVCEGFGLPSCNDLGMQFLFFGCFFADVGELRSNLINQIPQKSLICTDSHQDKPTQFNVN